MDKLITFETQDTLGHHFAEAINITPRGGGLEKVAGVVHPQIAAYLKSLRSDPAYQFVLMTPMGAFEYWGMNVNGDIFPEVALGYDLATGDPIQVIKALEQRWLTPFGQVLPPGNYTEFGYKTFLNALRYKHHANKNPEVSYGDIVLSVYNPAMHRVEVIVRHDREKAKRVGADDIIKDIDAGKARSISMGCRTPFDICTKCGHISRTTQDYCDCLKYQMGSTLPSGVVVGAVNPFPRFFDLSDVIVPAAKESGDLGKVASVYARSGLSKKADKSKSAEIQKEVSSNSDEGRSLSALGAAEPDLPMKALMDRYPDPVMLLTTLAALGIVAKPEEFQYALLCRMGKRDEAQTLWGSRQVFRPAPADGCMDMDPDDYSPDMARALAPWLSDRSGLYPHLPSRVMRISIMRAVPAAPPTLIDGMPKMAEAYDAYRRGLSRLPSLVEVALSRDPEYYNRHFFGNLLSDSLTKVASAHGTRVETSIVPLYVYSAYRDTVSSRCWSYPVSPLSPTHSLFGPSF